MRAGFLIVETRADRPHRVRIRTQEDFPPTDRGARPGGAETTQLRYAARFEDLDAALMHVHNALRHSLIDTDRRLYRADAVEAIAAADAVALPHRRVHLDPLLAEEPALAAQIARHRARQQRNDRVWQTVGVAAFLILAALLLLIGP